MVQLKRSPKNLELDIHVAKNGQFRVFSLQATNSAANGEFCGAGPDDDDDGDDDNDVLLIYCVMCNVCEVCKVRCVCACMRACRKSQLVERSTSHEGCQSLTGCR